MLKFQERIEARQALNRMNNAAIAIERESFSQEHTNAAIALLDSMAIDGGLYADVNLSMIHEQAYHGRVEDSYGSES